MIKLTQEQLRIARDIGATHYFFGGIFRIEHDNTIKLYINNQWGNVTEYNHLLVNEEKYKIDFSPLDKKEDESQKPDMVNHPPHYQTENGIECIDAIRAALGADGFVAYCRGNAIKYSWRAGKKSLHSEDLRKALWYLDRAAQELEK